MSGWWTEQYAHFSVSLALDLTMGVGSVSIADVTLALDSPSLTMDAAPTSTGVLAISLAPEVSFLGVNYNGTVALNLDPILSMEAASHSVGDFTLTLTPEIGMSGVEHYTATFGLTLTPTISTVAYIKQLPHPIPWTL